MALVCALPVCQVTCETRAALSEHMFRAHPDTLLSGVPPGCCDQCQQPLQPPEELGPRCATCEAIAPAPMTAPTSAPPTATVEDEEVVVVKPARRPAARRTAGAFKCPYCDRPLTAQAGLTQHLRYTHASAPCPACHATFDIAKQLSLHLLNGGCGQDGKSVITPGSVASVVPPVVADEDEDDADDADVHSADEQVRSSSSSDDGASSSDHGAADDEETAPPPPPSLIGAKKRKVAPSATVAMTVPPAKRARHAAPKTLVALLAAANQSGYWGHLTGHGVTGEMLAHGRVNALALTTIGLPLEAAEALCRVATRQ